MGMGTRKGNGVGMGIQSAGTRRGWGHSLWDEAGMGTNPVGMGWGWRQEQRDGWGWGAVPVLVQLSSLN